MAVAITPPLQKADMNIAVFFTKATEVLYSLKNTHPKKNTSTMGVCSIHCSGCECFNVDETARDIDTRFKEHKYACNRHSHLTGNRHILFTKKNNKTRHNPPHTEQHKGLYILYRPITMLLIKTLNKHTTT